MVGEEHWEDRNRREAGPSNQVWERGGSIPAQVSLLRVPWEDRQVELIKCMGLSAEGLFLKLVSPETSMKWADSFQDYLSHPYPKLCHTESCCRSRGIS